MTYFENLFFSQFLDFPSGIEVTYDTQGYIDRIADTFPMKWGKIDWANLRYSSVEFETDSSRHHAKFVEFLESAIDKYYLDDAAFYLGDNVTEFVIVGEIRLLRRYLPELLSYPQHHFLMSCDLRWCFMFTMEGEMGFGSFEIPAG